MVYRGMELGCRERGGEKEGGVKGTGKGKYRKGRERGIKG